MRSTFFRNLAVLTLIALVPAFIGGFVFYRVLAAQSLDARLTSHEVLANRFVEYVDGFVRHSTQDLWVVAQHEAIRDALKTAPKLEAKYRSELDVNWRDMDQARLDRVLDNEASKLLRTVKDRHLLFDEIIVADTDGNLVAASNKTTDFIQDDECWWQAPMERPRNENCDQKISSDASFQSIIMNVDDDESSGTKGYDVSQLVLVELDGKRLGVIKATMSYEVLERAIKSRLGSSFVLMNSLGETFFDDSEASVRPIATTLFDASVLDRLRGESARRVIPITDSIETKDGVREVIGALAMTETGWFVFTYESKTTTLDTTSWNTWLLFVAIAFGAIALAGFLFVFFCRRAYPANS